jgi:hypothetical protein
MKGKEHGRKVHDTASWNFWEEAWGPGIPVRGSLLWSISTALKTKVARK